MKIVKIYTDGACSGNPGPGGYGVVMLYGANRQEMSGAYQLTTNNRMEILAAILALEALNQPCEVQLFSDSKYLVDGIEKGWVARWQANNWMRNKSEPAVNVDLWKRLLVQLARHTVQFSWVKGHASNAENNRCDALAVAAIKNGEFQQDEGYNV